MSVVTHKKSKRHIDGLNLTIRSHTQAQNMCLSRNGIFLCFWTPPNMWDKYQKCAPTLFKLFPFSLTYMHMIAGFLREYKTNGWKPLKLEKYLYPPKEWISHHPNFFMRVVKMVEPNMIWWWWCYREEDFFLPPPWTLIMNFTRKDIIKLPKIGLCPSTASRDSGHIRHSLNGPKQVCKSQWNLAHFVDFLYILSYLRPYIHDKKNKNLWALFLLVIGKCLGADKSENVLDGGETSLNLNFN